MTHKICPICGTPAHQNAAMCSACGASLRAVPQITNGDENEKTRPKSVSEYDQQYGETDLFESNLNWRGGTYILGVLTFIALLSCAGIVFMLGSGFYNMMFSPMTATPSGEMPVEVQPLATNTVRPTIVLNTVTIAPTLTETPAPTETPGPCMQEVLAGDSLIAMVQRCGHRDLAVIDEVLEINGLDAPEVIRSGQILEIPWPTPTPGPEEQSEGDGSEATAEAGADGETAISVAAVPTNPLSGLPVPPTPTLQPGVAWHTVTRDENIIIVAYEYGADIKILSELNPEITFSQCDFGLETGGEQCVVSIFEGQRIRVPAPTPTPTLSPTPSGSETPTPTPTATFNAPSAISPGDRTLFQRDDLVTLRWVASGTLGQGQVYRVTVKDVTSGLTYSDDTNALFFIVPKVWQGNIERRHIYEWTVKVIDVDRPDEPYFTTNALSFEWEALNWVATESSGA